MLNKLKVLEDKYKELSQKVADPDIISDQPTWQKLMKETSEIEPIVMKYREYSKASQSIAESTFLPAVAAKENWPRWNYLSLKPYWKNMKMN